MNLRVEVLARGPGGTSQRELSTISAWEEELFADDKELIESFVWEDGSGLGFNIHTYCGDEFVGFGNVFVRLARADDSAVLVGALGGVMTARASQKAGVGSATVGKANQLILHNLRADFGVLLCKSALVSFYERLGWHRMAGRVLIRQPSGTVRWPHETMVLPTKGVASIPSELDLCGLPF